MAQGTHVHVHLPPMLVGQHFHIYLHVNAQGELATSTSLSSQPPESTPPAAPAMPAPSSQPPIVMSPEPSSVATTALIASTSSEVLAIPTVPKAPPACLGRSAQWLVPQLSPPAPPLKAAPMTSSECATSANSNMKLVPQKNPATIAATSSEDYVPSKAPPNYVH